ncbi:MAG: hypothetical protein IPI66_12065 [Chitinophagaceae bacterium]|nr:hypothetical protein [Chitinophagaceae bacterium]MBL0056301.1 hypothetical protein [Chitinophagaceae bacterium]
MKKLIHRITNWEAWPFKILYAPIAPVWVWYMIRSGAVWFFTPSNPKITFGGLDGEPKKEMYDLLPKELYPATFNVMPGLEFNQLQANLHQSGIRYPFIVKPEIGCQGILLRKIDHESALKQYHAEVPCEYMIQSLVEYPMEISVFYIRHPREEKGMITGLLHKIPLQVTGDGILTLEQLVLQHPKGHKRMEEMKAKHRNNWNQVIPAGEKYMLSYAANHNRGAHFVDLKDQIDDQLVSVFDQISHQVNDFFYGRYDIMCNSVEDVKNGRYFTILEYNGCGAEPNHFYDTGYTLFGAYREILKHWKALYSISKYNSSQGIKPWPYLKGRKFLQETNRLFKVLREADARIA